jgi:hypothetical protein
MVLDRQRGLLYTLGVGHQLLAGLRQLIAGRKAPDELAADAPLEQNKIDVREIVRQEFLARLAASKAFAAVVSEGAQANFELAIESYGLGPGFSMRPIDKPLKPMLRLKAKLSAPNCKVLWENTGYITNMGNGTPSYRFDDYFADASRTRDAFKKAAESVVKELLESIGAAGQI